MRSVIWRTLLSCSLLVACGEPDPSQMDSDDPRLHKTMPYDKDDVGPSNKEPVQAVTPGTEIQPTGSSKEGGDNADGQKQPEKKQEPAATTEPTKDAATAEACYQECLKNNQARAVAWEMVERDCKASCDGTAPKLELK